MADRLSTTELQDRFVAAVGPTALIAASMDASGRTCCGTPSPSAHSCSGLHLQRDGPSWRPADSGAQDSTHRSTSRRTGRARLVGASTSCFYVAMSPNMMSLCSGMLLCTSTSRTRRTSRFGRPMFEMQPRPVYGCARTADCRPGMEVVICAPSQTVIEAIDERASSGEVRLRGTDHPTTRGQPLHASSTRWLRHSSVAGIQIRS